MWVLFFVVLLVSAVIGSSIGTSETGFGAFYFGLFWSAVAYTVFARCLLVRGKKPGKWLVGIRAADKRNGSLPGLGRTLVRETIGKCLSGLFLGLGYFWAIFDKDTQAWHDKIARTVALRQSLSRASEEQKAMGLQLDRTRLDSRQRVAVRGRQEAAPKRRRIQVQKCKIGIFSLFIQLLFSNAVLSALLTMTAAAQGTNAPSGSQVVSQSAGTYDELKNLLMTRYDQKTVVAEVSGLYAGVATEATGFGPDLYGIIWSHFAANMQVPDRIGALSPRESARVGWRKKTSDLHQLDDHTFGQLNEGKNLGVVQQGESLKVYKFYVYPDHIEFVLSPTGFGHLSNETTGVAVAADLGFLFNFYFNKGLIKDDHDYAAIVSEINKYLLPQGEAKELATATAAAKQNVEIDPGMTEEQVIQKLGQPLQAVKFGDQKTLKFNGMTIVLKDGKVVDLKVD